MLSAGLGLTSPVGVKRAMPALAKFMRVGPRSATKSKMGTKPCVVPSDRASVCPALRASIAGKTTRRMESPQLCRGLAAWHGQDAVPAPRWLLQRPLVLNPTGRGEMKAVNWQSDTGKTGGRGEQEGVG